MFEIFFYFVWVDVGCDVLSNVFGLSDISSISILISGKHSSTEESFYCGTLEIEADGSSSKTEKSEMSYRNRYVYFLRLAVYFYLSPMEISISWSYFEC